MHDAVILDVSLIVERKDDAEAQLLLVRAQRTDEVTQPFGQHRYGAVDQIDARGTLRSLFVYRGTLLDIVADIGDMHANLPQLALPADAERIVKVLGVLRVNGAGEDVSEVLAALDFLFRDARIYLLCGILDIFRILVRKAILRQDGMHLDVVVALLTQHVDNLSDDVLRLLRRPLRNLDHCLVARLAALQLLLRYQHVVHKDVSFRHEEGIVLLHLQLTHGLVNLVRQNLYHHRLLHVPLTTCHHSHAHPVTIHGKQRVTLRDKDVLAAVIGLKRVLAVSLADECTLLHLRLQVQLVAIVAVLRQEVVPSHLVHRLHCQHLGRMRRQLQVPEYLLKRERLARILLEQCLQHLHQALLRQSLTTLVLAHSRTVL